MNPTEVMEILAELRVLPYFPNDEFVLVALARLAGSMCSNIAQVRWLVGRMTSGIYACWPGPQEMRACFCGRFKPRDGINAYSTVYLDGLPPDPTAPRKGIEAPVMKQLASGEPQSADPALNVILRVSSEMMAMGGPTTPEEIAAAPEWLRRIEGYGK
jgi:hypothetical protein